MFLLSFLSKKYQINIILYCMHCVRMFVSFGILGLFFLFFLMVAGETEELDLTEFIMQTRRTQLTSQHLHMKLDMQH